jgi:hypothetical protein
MPSEYTIGGYTTTAKKVFSWREAKLIFWRVRCERLRWSEGWARSLAESSPEMKKDSPEPPKAVLITLPVRRATGMMLAAEGC